MSLKLVGDYLYFTMWVAVPDCCFPGLWIRKWKQLLRTTFGILGVSLPGLVDIFCLFLTVYIECEHTFISLEIWWQHTAYETVPYLLRGPHITFWDVAWQSCANSCFVWSATWLPKSDLPFYLLCWYHGCWWWWGRRYWSPNFSVPLWNQLLRSPDSIWCHGQRNSNCIWESYIKGF